ncbi:wax ester/triacylglycerol synthase domain-containing protein [Nocardia sp. NPDC051756]|uniref:wax ester/triacylglycerol synthase domain-containing protein n=1 Tax=Nocardia sp. NPDC051756 TaxID=3154751 RepID=UPI00341E679B
MIQAQVPVAIERAGPMDLTVLATDHASIPMQIGAILLFDSAAAPTPASIQALLVERIPRIPRFRQVLRRTPFGCGRPIWVDDPEFSIDRHLAVLVRSKPVAEQELFLLATDLLCVPLARDRPLWRAVLVHAPGRCSLIVIVHHVLTDGVGGLVALSALTDEGPVSAVRGFPQPPPDGWALAADATGERLRAIRTLPTAFQRVASGLRELGFSWASVRPIERTSLNRPTSPRRRITRVEVDLAEIVAIARHADGTVNDVVLAALTGALLDLLRARGERPRQLVISVPIAGRRGGDLRRLGNDTGVRPIAVAAIDDDSTRLTDIVAVTSAAKRTTVRASSAAPLGGTFRLLHRLGLFQAFIDHQRLVHTFETNLRGPGTALHLAGHRVATLVPLVATPGNVGVTFAVLSYAGSLGVTVIADPDIVTDQDALTAALTARFERLRQPDPSVRR